MIKATLPVLALTALILASCAKEKDGYDKNLTQDTWALSSANVVNTTVTKNVYTDGTPNTTSTQTSTNIIENGSSSEENYSLNQEVGLPDFFTKSTQVSDFSLTYKFEKEGTFQSDRSNELKSTTTESTGVPASTITVTSEPTVSSNTGIWNWNNTGDQKSILTFDLGSLQVDEISKSELNLKLNTSSTEITKPNSAQTKTETNTRTISINMTK